MQNWEFDFYYNVIFSGLLSTWSFVVILANQIQHPNNNRSSSNDTGKNSFITGLTWLSVLNIQYRAAFEPTTANRNKLNLHNEPVKTRRK